MSDDLATAEGAQPVFLVERFWPGVTHESFVASIERLLGAVRQMASEGRSVRLLHSTLIPAEEVVLGLMQGPNAEAVAEANERAETPFQRMVEVLNVVGDRRSGDEG